MLQTTRETHHDQADMAADEARRHEAVGTLLAERGDFRALDFERARAGQHEIDREEENLGAL